MDAIMKATREELVEFILQIEGHDVGVTIPKRKVDPMQQVLQMMWKREEEEREKQHILRKQEGEEREKQRSFMMELEKQRITVEEHRIQVEEQRIISDREEREARAQRDIEREERLEQERREEIRRRDRKEQEQEAERRSKPSRLQRAAKKLEKIIPKMNHEDMDVPIYFRTVEGYFRDFGIEEDLRVAILLPHMNEKARRITSMLSDVQRANYEGVKNTLLQAFKMTPRTLQGSFHGCWEETG